MNEKRSDTEMLAEFLKKLPAEKQEFVNGYIQGYIDKLESEQAKEPA